MPLRACLFDFDGTFADTAPGKWHLMPLRACLFDFDGTFADTAPGLINAANAIYKKYDKPLISYEQGRVISSDGTQAFLRQRFDELEDNFSSLTLEFLQFYNTHILDEVDLFPGISEFLSHLKDKKFLGASLLTNLEFSLKQFLIILISWLNWQY